MHSLGRKATRSVIFRVNADDYLGRCGELTLLCEPPAMPLDPGDLDSHLDLHWYRSSCKEVEVIRNPERCRLDDFLKVDLLAQVQEDIAVELTGSTADTFISHRCHCPTCACQSTRLSSLPNPVRCRRLSSSSSVPSLIPRRTRSSSRSVQRHSTRSMCSCKCPSFRFGSSTHRLSHIIDHQVATRSSP